MKTRSVSFEMECPTIQYSFELIENEDKARPAILIVKFMGEYRDGSMGNDDATYMSSMLEAANMMWVPESILIDLYDFSYKWGNDIEGVFDYVRGVRVAVVVGPKNRKAFSTLVHGIETEKEIVDNHVYFDDKEKAIDFLLKDLKEKDTPSK